MKHLSYLVLIYLLCPIATEGSARPKNEADDPARFAIVIGKNESENSRQATLKYADDDAVAMHLLLSEAGVDSRLLVSMDPDTAALRPFNEKRTPTLNVVRRTIEKLFTEIRHAKSAGKTTEFIFYYSGHGDVTNGEGFVVLKNSRLTRSFLVNRIIAESPADANHIFIDACKSYFMVFDKSPGGTRRPFNGSFGVRISARNLDRTGFILSASADEDSHEWERYQAGVFSYEVRSALRGGADVDRNGQISYGELGAFVAAANRGIKNPKFRPNFMVSPPGRASKNLSNTLLRWKDKTGSLTIEDAVGHYFFETADGIRIADIHTNRSEPLAMHLPNSRPLFVRRTDNQTEGVITSLQSTSVSTLAMQPATTSRKSALSIAFDQLFTTPFGSETVKAFNNLYAEKQRHAANTDLQSPTKSIELALLGAAVSTLLAGGTMSILTLSKRNKAKDASQTDIPSINQQIHHFNRAAVSLYSVAAATGISFLTLKILFYQKKKRAVVLFPIVSPTELTLGLSGTWPR